MAVLLFMLLPSQQACHRGTHGGNPAAAYLSNSRFTDPGEKAYMLETLPQEPLEIASVAEHLTVHHNLLPHYRLPKSEWKKMRAVWPPRTEDVLRALEETGPGNLEGTRGIEERIRSACMLESHLLAGMLRFRQVPTRLRAGYFKDVYTDEERLVEFWEEVSRQKGVAQQLLEEDPERWRDEIHEHTLQQVEANKHVEHWVAEYWDSACQCWRILDANTAFLDAMSGIKVTYHLPRRHFEYAFESWMKMRTDPGFNPDQYAEWPQDGYSHIRSQLLWDFYSLLNHDIAGYDNSQWPEEGELTDERRTYAFVKERQWEDLSPSELHELDALAELLATDPSIDELVSFYRSSPALQFASIEADPYSFLNSRPEP